MSEEIGGVTTIIANLEGKIRRQERMLNERRSWDRQLPRPAVASFADAMEVTLRKYDDSKSGWADMVFEELLERIEDEVGELRLAIKDRSEDQSVAEAIDIANYCMMFHDRSRMLTRERGLARYDVIIFPMTPAFAPEVDDE